MFFLLAIGLALHQVVLFEASRAALCLSVVRLSGRLEVHLLLQVELLPRGPLALSKLGPLPALVDLVVVVVAHDALTEGVLLWLVEGIRALVVVTRQAQHLVQEIGLLLVVAVDLTAEVL